MGLWTGAFSLLYYMAIIITICTAALYQWALIGCTFYIGFGTFVGLLRNHMRVKHFIREHGDIATDLLCGIFAPMFTLSQIEEGAVHGADREQEEERRPGGEGGHQRHHLSHRGGQGGAGATGPGRRGRRGEEQGSGCDVERASFWVRVPLSQAFCDAPPAPCSLGRLRGCRGNPCLQTEGNH
ncbi:unnamed protein product [Prorocentrum cordatum]|uniref:Uncharacterized protein n=1 Tax=Prorocentrum cordatum TaxID=2364126 RepID=A0ABN9WVS1_9DINO|nr:unnamed protein product [Polarella glacialis]